MPERGKGRGAQDNRPLHKDPSHRTQTSPTPPPTPGQREAHAAHSRDDARPSRQSAQNVSNELNCTGRAYTFSGGKGGPEGRGGLSYLARDWGAASACQALAAACDVQPVSDVQTATA